MIYSSPRSGASSSLLLFLLALLFLGFLNQSILPHVRYIGVVVVGLGRVSVLVLSFERGQWYRRGFALWKFGVRQLKILYRIINEIRSSA